MTGKEKLVVWGLLFVFLMVFSGCGTSNRPSGHTISGKVVGASGVVVNLSGDATSSAVCDADGNFSFIDLPNGSYVVTPSKAGFDLSPPSRAVPVTGQDAPDVNFTASYSTRYSISGVVLGSDGVTVTLSGAASSQTTIHPDGYYSFNNLNSGDYTVTPAKDGYVFSPARADVIISGESRYGESFVGGPSGSYSISGTVTGVTTVVLTLGGDASAVTVTNVDGYYSFSNLKNGSYTVLPVEDGYTFNPLLRNVTVNGASSASNDFAGTSTRTYSISGTVLGADNVILTLGGDSSATTATSSLGYFVFGNLDNGSYTVTPSKSGYTFYPGSRTVTVKDDSVSGNNFSASSPALYSVSGYIFGTENAVVSLSGDAGGTTFSRPDGYYAFNNLNAGSYTVTPSKSGYVFSPLSETVTITNESSSGNNFTASSTAKYSISGSISGLVKSNVTLKLSGDASATFVTEADGYYYFNNLANGNYVVTPTYPKSSWIFFVPSYKDITINGASSRNNDFVSL